MIFAYSLPSAREKDIVIFGSTLYVTLALGHTIHTFSKEEETILIAILIVSLIIMLGVLLMTMFTINKGYQYEHKVDPLPEQIPEDHSENSTQQ